MWSGTQDVDGRALPDELEGKSAVEMRSTRIQPMGAEAPKFSRLRPEDECSAAQTLQWRVAVEEGAGEHVQFSGVVTSRVTRSGER